MRRFWRDNGLSLTMVGFFLLLLAGQTLTGWHEHNADLQSRQAGPLSLSRYLASGHFLEATAENWESEFLQMFIYVVFTVFLYQRGSSESRTPGEEAAVDADPRAHRTDPAAPWPVRRGGWMLKLYENSLGLAFLGLFLMSFVLHAVGGLSAFNEEQRLEGQPESSLLEYFSGSRFWFESLQNWQSEFLAVAAMVLLSIHLRQRGSPESKPVAAPHSATGSG